MIPCIDYSYPLLTTKQYQEKYPPPLFYPDFMKSTIQRKEDLDSFLVILTDEKGNR